jgi:predicted Zn-dependent protease
MNLFTKIGIFAALIAATACATSPLGRKQLIIVSDDDMNQMGIQAFEQMKKETPIEHDPGWNQYVQCVAKPITVTAGDKMKVKNWEIVVFKDKTANAFALPGGKIGVHTGILPVAKTDAQLAAILGHEVGHVIARHSAERVSEQAVAQGGLAAAGVVTNNGPLMAALGLGAQVGVLLPHSRTQESEADLIGLDLMSRAGFDPRQSVDLWKNMMAASGGAPPEFLSTHPAGETRIKDLQGDMKNAMKKYEKSQSEGKHPECRRPG